MSDSLLRKLIDTTAVLYFSAFALLRGLLKQVVKLEELGWATRIGYFKIVVSPVNKCQIANRLSLVIVNGRRYLVQLENKKFIRILRAIIHEVFVNSYCLQLFSIDLLISDNKTFNIKMN